MVTGKDQMLISIVVIMILNKDVCIISSPHFVTIFYNKQWIRRSTLMPNCGLKSGQNFSSPHNKDSHHALCLAHEMIES